MKRRASLLPLSACKQNPLLAESSGFVSLSNGSFQEHVRNFTMSDIRREAEVPERKLAQPGSAGPVPKQRFA